jgi:hypothetical protein
VILNRGVSFEEDKLPDTGNLTSMYGSISKELFEICEILEIKKLYKLL